jgi:integrase
MATTNLLELEVAALICPIEKLHIEIFDSNIKGLYIDVMKGGRKSYRLRYRLNQKLSVLTIGDAKVVSCQEAQEQALDILRKIRLGKDPKRSPSDLMGPSVADFFNNKYLPFVKSYKRSWATDVSMVKNHVVAKLGHKQMSAVSVTDIAAFMADMKSSGYANGTCNRALVLLRYGYELALRWKLDGVENNPVKEILNIKDDNKIERYLSPPETILLLDAIRESENEMLQFIVLFLIYTGARKREVLEAKWKDIDWTQKSWRIPKTKSGKIRHVPLSLGAMNVLVTLRGKIFQGQFQDKPIFGNPRTQKPYVSFFYSWNNARIRAGMPDFRIHDLRHSFASCLVNAGRSLYEVQELLGHADIKTTSRYAHLSRERLIEAVETVPQIKIGENMPLRPPSI